MLVKLVAEDCELFFLLEQTPCETRTIRSREQSCDLLRVQSLFPLPLLVVEIKTNQNEFDDYIENIINKHTYTLEDLTKEEYRKLIIDYLVHLQMEKIQLNPLEIAANHEIQSKDVKRLFSKLQYAPQKSDKVALLLEELYDIPPGITRLVAWNICLDIPKVL